VLKNGSYIRGVTAGGSERAAHPSRAHKQAVLEFFSVIGAPRIEIQGTRRFFEQRRDQFRHILAVEIAQRIPGDALKAERGACTPARPQVDHGVHQPGLQRDHPDKRPRAFFHRNENVLMPHRGITVSQFQIARFAQPLFDRRKCPAQCITQRTPDRVERSRIGHVIGEIVARVPIVRPAGREDDHHVSRFEIPESRGVTKIHFAGALAKTFLQCDRNPLPGPKIFRVALPGQASPG
jgi:hypothetical protein